MLSLWDRDFSAGGLNSDDEMGSCILSMEDVSNAGRHGYKFEKKLIKNGRKTTGILSGVVHVVWPHTKHHLHDYIHDMEESLAHELDVHGCHCGCSIA